MGANTIAARQINALSVPRAAFLSAAAACRSAEVRHMWDDLLNATNQVYAQYNSPEWFEHLQATGSADSIRLGIVRNDKDQVIGLAPFRTGVYNFPFRLKSWTLVKMPVRTVFLLGSEPLLPPEPGAHDDLFLALCKKLPQNEAVYLHSVPTSSFLWQYLQTSRAIRDHFLLLVPWGIRPLHLLDLPDTFVGYLQKFNAKKRSDLKRKVRLFEERGGGPLQLQRIETADQVPAFLDGVVRILNRSWQRWVVNSSLDNNPGNQHRLADLAGRNLLRSYLLQCGDKPCAFVLGYQFRDIYHYADPRYDQTYKTLSPGTVLLWLMLEDLFRHRPPRRLNFGVGDARYKREFGNRQYQDAAVLLLRKTATNRIRRSSHAAFQSLVHFVKKLGRQRSAAEPEQE
jgi:CelD/BcsL family acetyltransferase involved in cellulose biosynthesis